MTTIQRMFTVDGKPFFPLGGQVHNSSAYTMEGLEPASALYSGIFLERVGRDQRLSAIADYNAIGYAPFGIESYLDHQTGSGDAIRAEVKPLVDSLRCVAAAMPLILRYQGTGKLHAVIQEEFLNEQYLYLGDYLALAIFGNADRELTWSDFRHYGGAKTTRGRGMVVQAGERQFYIVGAGYRIVFKKKGSPEAMLSGPQTTDFLLTRLGNYVRVEEGHFDQEGAWVTDRRRGGDESDSGIWVDPDVGIVRVVLGD